MELRMKSPNTPNHLSRTEINEGFQLLFDGKSLTGFRGFRKDHIPAPWQVRDGTIALTEPGGGDLITTATFTHFELRLEFNISADGNSGIMWHVSEDGDHTYESGPEFQILDSHARTGYPHERQKGNVCGALYDIIPARTGDFLGPNLWNEAIIRVDHHHITLRLNGNLTADVDTSSDHWKNLIAASKFATWPRFNAYPSGHIALQDHNDLVAFRSIRIKPLP